MRASTCLLTAALIAGCAASRSTDHAPRGPNVVVVMTDDQGWGDLGSHGNPVVRTPHLDALAQGSARLSTFYVHPVCAPTRAALMTGRWPQRTRAIDTYVGRAMMEPEEVTLAEVLREAGWATGIFGKWHLGDCYPMRPQDQGFEEVLVHRGGGIGQPSDPEGGEGRYTDPVLFHDGERVETRGYCTDVYFEAALGWMREQRAAGRPFLAYLPTNAPHGPFHDVPKELLAQYRAMDLSPAAFPAGEGQALPEQWDEDRLARIFAMVENVDQNVGRLMRALEEMGVLEDTLVLFLVDNGPNTRRWVGGLRGMKSEVHEGGVRSPLFAHWPARLAPGEVTGVGANVDLMPTILEACGVAPPDVRLDGRSLLPALEGRGPGPERALVIQAHRGDEAVRYHHALVRRGRWKLVNPSGFGRELERVEPAWELYDLQRDPFEQHDLAAGRPELVAELAAEYDAWFDDVSSTRPDNYAPPRIHVGGPQAREVHLTRQDWRRTSDDHGWGRDSLGHWEVRVVEPGPWSARVRFLEGQRPERVTLRVGSAEWSGAPAPDAGELAFEDLELPTGEARLAVELREGEKVTGAYQVILRLAP